MSFDEVKANRREAQNKYMRQKYQLALRNDRRL